MNCEKTLNLIDDLIESELAEPLAARVSSHVFACASCRERYELLKREKAIYANYLFDAEPPKDLWVNFQTRLETEREKTSHFIQMPAEANAGKRKAFGFLRFSPALAGAALLVVFGIGFGWLQLAPREADTAKYIAETKPNESQLPVISGEPGESALADSAAQIESGENNRAFENNKTGGKYKFVKTELVKTKNDSPDKKPIAARIVKIKREIVVAKTENRRANRNEPNEAERLDDSRIKNLEKEIAGQIERVELLLRSFRNAREVETVAAFDVEYEKSQARRLLEKNGRLRRAAESCGNAYAEELLSRVEPYLLDIAHLENNPAPDRVRDIKERVSVQGIIASLQIY